MWCVMWQWSGQSPMLLATNSISFAFATPVSVLFSGIHADSGTRPPSVPVTQKVWPCKWMG